MYPTKRQILAKKPEIDPKIIAVIKTWKKQCLKGWKNQSKLQKIGEIQVLIWIIAITYAITENKPKKVNLQIKNGSRHKYNPKKKTIYLDKTKPSILSALHELGHHLLGPSELTVCRWSIWLFKESFPGLYKNLVWKRHLLIKK